MKGTRWENTKNAAISILLGMVAMLSVEWTSTFCKIGGGYIIAQIVWVFLTAYDEILRKRADGRRRSEQI